MPMVRRVLRSHALVVVTTTLMFSFAASQAFADNTAPNEPSLPRPYDGAYEQLISSSIACSDEVC